MNDIASEERGIQVARKWQNWAHTASATPIDVVAAADPQQIADQVAQAGADGRTIRMIGSGHSFTPTAVANDIMLTPGGLTRVRSIDAEAGRITVDAGIDLTTLCQVLDANGLALTNMGDVRVQTLAGALQTGTHGCGRATGTFADMVVGLELVLGDGLIVTVDANNDPDLFNSARVGLGAFGIVTAITLAVEPRFRLHAHEFPASFEEVSASFDAWTAAHDHVEFYWFPHTGKCLVKHNDRTYDDAQPPGKFANWWEEDFLSNTVFGAMCRFGRAAPGYIPLLNKAAARVLSERDYVNDSWLVFTSPRNVRFKEMEYAIPRSALIPALTRVRKLMDDRNWRISFPVEVRSVPGDTSWLSPATERDTGYLAFHAFDRTDHEWFVAVEEVLREYNGRPHWGKMHSRSRDDLAPAYPKWDDAMRVRDRVDPNRVFANDYTRTVLGD